MPHIISQETIKRFLRLFLNKYSYKTYLLHTCLGRLTPQTNHSQNVAVAISDRKARSYNIWIAFTTAYACAAEPNECAAVGRAVYLSESSVRSEGASRSEAAGTSRYPKYLRHSGRERGPDARDRTSLTLHGTHLATWDRCARLPTDYCSINYSVSSINKTQNCQLHNIMGSLFFSLPVH